MTGCSYCGRPGCGWETCPERLEDRHGLPSDYDDEGKLKTDGGTSAGDAQTDPVEMSHDDLRNEWENVVERLRKGASDPEEDARLGDRRYDLWQEMADRVDDEPPECPECGGSGWSQTMGGPKSCTSCGLSLGFEHEDLVAEIDAYWEAVLAGPQEVDSDE